MWSDGCNLCEKMFNCLEFSENSHFFFQSLASKSFRVSNVNIKCYWKCRNGREVGKFWFWTCTLYKLRRAYMRIMSILFYITLLYILTYFFNFIMNALHSLILLINLIQTLAFPSIIQLNTDIIIVDRILQWCVSNVIRTIISWIDDEYFK